VGGQRARHLWSSRDDLPRTAKGANRVQANVKRVELKLPAGLVLSPGLANGLTACTEARFGLKEDRAPECPASSEIGDVQFVTPLIGTLTGKVYFGTPTPTAKLRNFVSVGDPRLRVKLIGDVTVDPQTGQVTNVFPDSPQVPFTEFFFRYKGGPRAVLSSPSACGRYAAVATMTPFSGGAAAAPSDTADVVGCSPPAFTPSLGLSSSDATAGADTALTVRIDRPDGQVRLLRSTVSLPPGLAGRLGSVPTCPVDQARAAACGEDSRVGSASVVVGNGSEPLALAARGRLKTVFDGIPDVPLSRLALTLDGGRNGIVTAGRDLCGSSALTFDASFESHGGAKRTSRVSAQVPCRAASSSGLRATATLTGVKRKRPALRLKVTAPSRLRELRITLPKQLRGRAGLARVTKLLAGGKGVRKPSLRMKGRTLTVALPKSGTRSPDLRLAGGALRLAGELTVGQRVTFTVTGIQTNGEKLTVRASARARP